MHLHKINMYHNKGLSVVELMVAMLIVTVLLLGVTTVYRASKQSYRINDEVAEMQENARFGFNNVTRELRMAGYTGCERIRDLDTTQNLNILSAATPEGFRDGLTGNTFVIGHTDANTNLVRDLTAPPGWDRTPAITVLNASACSAGLTDNAKPTANIPVDPNNNCDFKIGDVVMISDCANADIFTISRVNIDKLKGVGDIFFNPPLNRPPARLSKTYDTSAQVHKLERYTYYVGTSPIPGSNDPPGLRQIRLVNRANKMVLDDRLLIPYANGMLITYGVDTTNDGNADTFLDADQVPAAVIQKKDFPGQTPWSRVISVSISYGVTDAPDKQNKTELSKNFSTTVNFRNNTF